MSTVAPVDHQSLDQAARWLVRLAEAGGDAGVEAAFQNWYRASEANRRAWRRAEQLLDKLGGLPPALAMPALDRRIDRRALLSGLGALLVAPPLGWAGWRWIESNGWRADLRTATGERHDATLPDGSLLTLNTATAVDLRIGQGQRRLRLIRGEVLLRSAPGPVPLRIDTAEGWLTTREARFAVRQRASDVVVTVLHGTVRVRPGRGGETIVTAGHCAVFSATEMASVSAADATALAWTRGMLVANDMPLAAFAAELSRYRNGVLRVEPAVAGLSVSGAFPVTDTGLALGMLAATYPVAVETRFGGYWVTLSPAPA